MNDTEITLSWHIGSDDEGKRPRHAQWKACFYWKKNGIIIDSKSFDKDELKTEIERIRASGGDASEFEKAYQKL